MWLYSSSIFLLPKSYPVLWTALINTLLQKWGTSSELGSVEAWCISRLSFGMLTLALLAGMLDDEKQLAQLPLLPHLTARRAPSLVGSWPWMQESSQKYHQLNPDKIIDLQNSDLKNGLSFDVFYYANRGDWFCWCLRVSEKQWMIFLLCLYLYVYFPLSKI